MASGDGVAAANDEGSVVSDRDWRRSIRDVGVERNREARAKHDERAASFELGI